MTSPDQSRGDIQDLSKVVARQNAQLKALNEANLLLEQEADSGTTNDVDDEA